MLGFGCERAREVRAVASDFLPEVSNTARVSSGRRSPLYNYLSALEHPDGSPVGIGVSLAAVVVMPVLAFAKRRVAKRIGSEALKGDAANSLTCGYMAATVLVGLGLNALLGWWWAEDVAALIFLVWLIGETREAIEEAREATS